MTKIRILYIDDEENNLQSFKATFRRQHEIFTALSAKEAREFLALHNDIHIIVSDQRMPEKTGVEFFKEIKEEYPDALRILLTGYTDIETLTDAVNEGHIYRYITKPWSELELNNSFRNAYEMYKNRAEIKEKIRALEKSNDELNRFIYSLSHELRAPLASALGSIQLTNLENLVQKDTRLGEYWQIIEDCCNKLDYNINSTLQYYKNRKIDTVEKQVDFKTLLNRLVATQKNFFDERDEIDVDVVVNQPVAFYGDAFRIEVVLGNIISNAMKYQKFQSDFKTVKISAEISAENAVIKIKDNGKGIDPQDHEKIFTQFFRNDFGNGSGLGLFIAKEAVEKLNGTISVESQSGIGSTFTVNLPNFRTDSLNE